MPLWKKTTTICVALFVSAPFASESIAQRLSPLTPLPMPAVSAADNAPRSIFEAAPAAPLAQAPSARQPSPLTNPFKPMATPGAPIVKLATRPVYQPNPRTFRQIRLTKPNWVGCWQFRLHRRPRKQLSS